MICFFSEPINSLTLELFNMSIFAANPSTLEPFNASTRSLLKDDIPLSVQ